MESECFLFYIYLSLRPNMDWGGGYMYIHIRLPKEKEWGLEGVDERWPINRNKVSILDFFFWLQ